ncbi:MAG: arylesterase [Pelovirga sp.]
MKTPVLGFIILLTLLVLPLPAAEQHPTTILVLGDSLTAGYGLDQSSAFPARLQTALTQKGYQVQVINAGISGDTSAGGSARLEWSLSDNPDLVIVQLGANDALRGLAVKETRGNLASIIRRLQQRDIAVVLAGMLAPRNLGEDYYNSFDAIYPALAEEFDLPLYPFFLAGVAGEPELNLADGIHPNSAGVDKIVAGMLPLIMRQLEQRRSAQ